MKSEYFILPNILCKDSLPSHLKVYDVKFVIAKCACINDGVTLT